MDHWNEKSEGEREMSTNWEGKKILKGKVIRDESYYLVDKEGKYIVDEKGQPKLRWEAPGVDGDGFDENHREPNGEYKMWVELPVGTHLLRYGSPNGRFTAPAGTPFEELSLPYTRDSLEYNEYIVIADGVRVEVCTAERGRVGPLFDQPGGGIQYNHGKGNSVQKLLDDKKLERIELWK